MPAPEPAGSDTVPAAHHTAEYFNAFSTGFLPEHMGVVLTEVAHRRLCAELTVRPHLLAPNGFLHAGTIITLADTLAGYACFSHLPATARSFTTLELKSNFLGTARSGIIDCVCTAAHLGKSTQIWDATVSERGSGKTLALFRCTQMILYPTESPPEVPAHNKL